MRIIRIDRIAPMQAREASDPVNYAVARGTGGQAKVQHAKGLTCSVPNMQRARLGTYCTRTSLPPSETSACNL